MSLLSTRVPCSYEHTAKFITHFGFQLYRDFERHAASNHLLNAQYIGIPNDVEAFVAYCYDKNQGGIRAVGFIAFRKEEWNDSFYIYGSYTDPEFRRKGINGTLFDKLTVEARKRKIVRIDSNVSMHNKAMIRAFERQGRKATSINYTYFIAPWMEKVEVPPPTRSLLGGLTTFENSVVDGLREAAGSDPYYVVKMKYDRQDDPVEREHGDRIVFYSTDDKVLAVIGLDHYPSDSEVVVISDNMTFFKERRREQWILERSK